jgi:hypothetical protein
MELPGEPTAVAGQGGGEVGCVSDRLAIMGQQQFKQVSTHGRY